MKRFISFAISLLIGLVIFIAVMLKVGFGSVEQAFSLFFGLGGLVVLFFGFMFIFSGALKWQLILKNMGYDLPFKKLLSLWWVGFAISFLTPFAMFGGEFLRIYLTKKQFPQMSYSKNIASVAVDKLVNGTVFFVYLITGLLAFFLYGRLPDSVGGIAIMISAGFFLFALGFFYVQRMQRQSAIGKLMKFFGIQKRRFANSHTGNGIFQAEEYVFKFFSLKNKALWQAFSIEFLRYFFHITASVCLIFILTNQLTPLKAFASYGFTAAASLTPLPAMLGAFELGEGFAFNVLGFGFDIGTVFSMIWRAAYLALSCVGLIFLFKFSISLLQQKFLFLFNRG